MHFGLTTARAYATTLRPDDPFPVHLDCDTRLDSVEDGLWRCSECQQTGGLLRPTLPNMSSPFDRSLLEAVSWRLAADLALRHPQLRIFRFFPHEYASDVLHLRTLDASGPDVCLDRYPGHRIHVVRRGDGMEPEGGPWLWDEYLTAENLDLFVNRIEYSAGLWQGSEVSDREPTTEALVYDLIARLATHGILCGAPGVHRERVYIDNAASDTGWEGGPPAWWDEARGRNPDLTAPARGDLHNDPKWRFWRVHDDAGFDLILETSTGTIWSETFDAEALEEQGYDVGQHDLREVLYPPGNPRALELALNCGGHSDLPEAK